jgi:putative hemolysin
MTSQILQQGTHVLAASNGFIGLWELVLMFVLVLCSGFFSGAETAFFNLSPRQKKSLQTSDHKLQRLASKIIDKPSQLLSCLLFGNMLVNVLYFAVSSVLATNLSRSNSVTVASIVAFSSFIVLVMFGEILPKSLAYLNSKRTCIIAPLPVTLCLRIFTPIVTLSNIFVVEPVIRLLLGPKREPNPVTPDEFITLVEQIQKRGVISADENRLLSEIVELGFLKVRDCLRPRVDMVTCDVTDTLLSAQKLMQNNNLTKLPVYAGNIDNIIGLVHLRTLLLNMDKSLDKIVQEVNFVPEQKTVVSLLQFFRQTHTDTAVVVDEYGGIAGLVRLEDIAEELLGPIEITDDIEPIEQTGPFEYRLAGSLPVRDWTDVFGIAPTDERFSTIGGLVTALIGRIPKTGDIARRKNIKFTVERVHKRRIETLLLTLEAKSTDDQ